MSTSADLVAELEGALRRHSIACWFPRSVIAGGAGGFQQDFHRDWTPLDPPRRSVVFQCRMVWAAATLGRRMPYPGLPFAEWAEEGLAHVRRDYWHGGLAFWKGVTDETHAYPVAFGIYAAAAVHRLTSSPASASFAREIFDWLDGTAWDAEAGAYVEALPLDGAPGDSGRGSDLMGLPYGARTSNTLLHLVEALTELVLALGHPVAVERLATLVRTLEACVARDGNALYRSYDVGWRPLDRAVSWGHDVEAFHLVMRARRALQWPDETILEGTARQALARGLDGRRGGLMFGRRPRRLRATRKVWWAQAEALASLALLHRRSASPGRGSPWLDDLERTWRWVRRRQLDEVRGGWIEAVSRRGLRLTSWKGHAWKACYHEVRGLLDARDHLAGMEAD